MQVDYTDVLYGNLQSIAPVSRFHNNTSPDNRPDQTSMNTRERFPEIKNKQWSNLSQIYY